MASSEDYLFTRWLIVDHGRRKRRKGKGEDDVYLRQIDDVDGVSV